MNKQATGPDWPDKGICGNCRISQTCLSSFKRRMESCSEYVSDNPLFDTLRTQLQEEREAATDLLQALRLIKTLSNGPERREEVGREDPTHTDLEKALLLDIGLIENYATAAIAKAESETT